MSNLIAIDTETTSIGPDRRVWELGLIVRGDLPAWWHEQTLLRQGAAASEEPGHYRWFVHAADLDLGYADPFALKVGGFYDRHPQYSFQAGRVVREAELLSWVERLTRGAHLLGAVPNFDADVLDRRMRAHGIAPSWHYHLIDIEAMAVGYLHGLRVADPQGTEPSLPWKSDDLSRACGVEPPGEEERHTALGDARYALRWYDAITGGKP